MHRLGTLGVLFYHISKSSVQPDILKLISLLLSFPCFHASNFFFSIAYGLNQRRALVQHRRQRALGKINCKAIVVGADDRNAHIYLVDNYIKVNCYDDVGFVAIGIGAWHARSQLMQARYSNMWKFNHAVGIAYAAKKQSEIAPGVGAETDLFVVNRDGTNPLMPELKQA